MTHRVIADCERCGAEQNHTIHAIVNTKILIGFTAHCDKCKTKRTYGIYKTEF